MNDEPESITEAHTAAQKQAEHRKRSRIPVPAAGEGVFIHYTMSGLQKLGEALEKHDRDGETWFSMLERLLLAGDPETIRACLDLGLKVDGPDGKPVPATGIDLDDPGFSYADVVPAILNTTAVWFYGKTYEEMLAEATAARELAAAEARKEWQESKAG